MVDGPAFSRQLSDLDRPAPWRLCEEEPGVILAADGSEALKILGAYRTQDEDSRLALLIVTAVNAMAGA